MTQSLWIKICGITTLADGQKCAELGVSAIGFNFYRQSARYVEPLDARAIIEQLPPSIEMVGLFVNSPAEEVREVLSITGISTIQFHGDENAAYLSQFSAFDCIRAVRPTTIHDVQRLVEQALTPRLILDAFVPDAYGGTGIQVSEPILEAAHEVARRNSISLVVSGGLRPDTVGGIVEKYAPYGVDVASGVESAAGIKDHALLSAFVDSARKGEHARQ